MTTTGRDDEEVMAGDAKLVGSLRITAVRPCSATAERVLIQLVFTTCEKRPITTGEVIIVRPMRISKHFQKHYQGGMAGNNILSTQSARQFARRGKSEPTNDKQMSASGTMQGRKSNGTNSDSKIKS